MKGRIPVRLRGLVWGGITLVALCFYNVLPVQAATWQNEISIYGWYAGVDGTTNIPGGLDPDISVDASEIIEDLSLSGPVLGVGFRF